jgi:hypothetical protein
MKPLHVLKADGQTFCGLKHRTEGLRPYLAHMATCKRCLKTLSRLSVSDNPKDPA